VTAVSWTFVSFDLLCFESMPGDVTSGNSTDCSQCRSDQSIHRESCVYTARNHSGSLVDDDEHKNQKSWHQ
jgi:hypothetical protein